MLLFTSLPPILGHAGVATLDMACAATMAAALYQFVRWLENPVWGRSVVFGGALGLAFLSKFSSLAFLAACGAGAVICLAAVQPRTLFASGRLWPRVRHGLIAIGVTFLLMWAGYRFNLTPLSERGGSHPSLDRLGANSLLRKAAHRVFEVPLPLMEVVKGVEEGYQHDRQGHDSYLLGQYRKTGWWSFFPVVLGVKTPIGFLVLTVAGMVMVSKRLRRSPWQQVVTAMFPLAILAVCITSRIDLGVRHILSIYPALAVIAGHAVSRSFGLRGRLSAVLSIVLACSAVIDSWLAHPDYLAYFNQAAGGHPERILCESDLDWGQDLHRLSQRLKAHGVDRVAVRYFGTALLEKSDLPQYRILLPDEKPDGYIAISARFIRLGCAKDGAYC